VAVTGEPAIGRSDDRANGRADGRGVLLRLRVTLSGAKGPGRRFGRFTSLRVTTGRGLAVLALALALARPVSAQLHGQHWDVTPETVRPTVGDTITVAFRVRLDERDLLFDTVPEPAVTPPDWVRIFSVDKLERQPDRIFIGRARMAFYRPGRQAVPVFQLPFMRSVKGLSRGTLSSDSASVEVVPVLTSAASATLRDIKEPAPSRGRAPLELLLGFAALGLAGWLAWRARHAPPESPAAVPEAAPPPPPPDPYDRALARLAAIEEAGWAAHDVALHYAEITDVLRDYLEVYGIPARERTTSELRWALRPALLAGDGLHRFHAVFDSADLVKFARARPGPGQAEAFAGAARLLLAEWREAVPAREAADAIR
jgi:hypothetical protein